MPIKRSFFSVKITVCVIAACMLVPLASAQPARPYGTWKQEEQQAKEMMSMEKMERHVSFLADSLCQGRATGTRGGIEAAFWVQRQFEQLGLLKFGDSYGKAFLTPDGRRGHNIIAMLPGALSVPRDRYIIVGAHYDHLGTLGGNLYPGADANASGVAVMVGLAEMFSAMRRMGKVYDSNIIFVAFDAKEMNMAGSEAFWDMIEWEKLVNPLNGRKITRSKVSLMVNIDQIGSTMSPVSKGREDYLIMLGSHSLKPRKRTLLEDCNTSSGLGMDICLSYYGSRNFTDIFYRLSDQRVFVENRIPAVQFTSGITMNTNKTRDTAASLDMNILRKRMYLIYHWIEGML